MEYVKQIRKELKEARVDLDLFGKNIANGIRDGPQAKEILRIQGDFISYLYHYSFRRPAELARLGYPPEEIEIAITTAKAQKEASIRWIKENYLRLKELQKELENEKKKESKSQESR
jgi:hypothetical protein